MKIAVCSDLHLEFGSFEPDHSLFANSERADILVLSGDICVAKDTTVSRYGSTKARVEEFFKRCSQSYAHVIYILGNHEHYNGDLKYTAGTLFAITCQFDNVYLLDNDVKLIDDVLFIGGTMWSDMNKEDALTLFHMRKAMNDFRIIQNSNRVVSRKVPVYEYNDDGSLKKDEKGYNIPIGFKFKEEPSSFSPEDAVEEHKKFLEYLKLMLSLNKDRRVVVCTHHTPSLMSCHPRYRHDTLMNGAYHSDLSELILDNPQIKLWTHGHTHELFDYQIGDTRVVCNPRGYVGYEAMSMTFAPKVVEV